MRRIRIRNQPLMLVAIVALAAVGSTLTTTAQSAMKPAKIKAHRQQLKQEIKGLNADLACKADADCAILEMGVKPCGGPWTYLVYSKASPRSEDLKRKVTEYNSLDKRINEIEQMMSDCSLEEQPTPKCVNLACSTAVAQASPIGD